MGERELSNLEVAQTIAKIMGKELKYEMVDFHSSRPGHDLRYALDGTFLKDEVGHRFPKDFEQSMRKTVEWFLSQENIHWLYPENYECYTTSEGQKKMAEMAEMGI